MITRPTSAESLTVPPNREKTLCQRWPFLFRIYHTATHCERAMLMRDGPLPYVHYQTTKDLHLPLSRMSTSKLGHLIRESRLPHFRLPARDRVASENIHLHYHPGWKQERLFCGDCGIRIVHYTERQPRMMLKTCVEGLTRPMTGRAVYLWTRQAIVPIADGVEVWRCGMRTLLRSRSLLEIT